MTYLEQNDSFDADKTMQDSAEDLARSIEAIVARRFGDVDAHGHNSGAALRDLASQLQGQSLHSMKLLAALSVNLSDLMCLSAWANGNAKKLSGESSVVSAAVEEIATTVRSIADASSTASTQTQQAKTISVSSAERAQTAEQAMTEIADSFNQLSGRMQSLDDAIETIGGFAKEIEAISNQTKLLALNATIEAARAGEAGKGFAVVASEVKNLSEQTSKTTEMIGRQLASLDEVMRAMIESMTEGGAKVREGASSFSAVVEEISEMGQCIDAADGQISSMTDALTVQSETIDSVVKNITEIAGLAKNNSDDSVNAIKLIQLAEEMIAGELGTYEGAHLPNQAVWRLRADHLDWKRRLAECLVGLTEASTLDRHALSLPFGPWFSRIDDNAIANSQGSRTLGALEGQLRSTGQSIAKEMAAGNVGEAIGAFFGMEEQSADALEQISKLEAMAG